MVKLYCRISADILEQWAQNLISKQDELAHIMSEEQGKPYAEAYGEIGVCAKFIRWNAEEGKESTEKSFHLLHHNNVFQ